jgi:hypothetical protein
MWGADLVILGRSRKLSTLDLSFPELLGELEVHCVGVTATQNDSHALALTRPIRPTQ